MKSILAKEVSPKAPFLSVRKKQPVQRRENVGLSKASLLFRNINTKTFYHTARRFTTAVQGCAKKEYIDAKDVFYTRYGC